jgi:hypothetical protein
MFDCTSCLFLQLSFLAYQLQLQLVQRAPYYYYYQIIIVVNFLNRNTVLETRAGWSSMVYGDYDNDNYIKSGTIASS